MKTNKNSFYRDINQNSNVIRLTFWGIYLTNSKLECGKYLSLLQNGKNQNGVLVAKNIFLYSSLILVLKGGKNTLYGPGRNV